MGVMEIDIDQEALAEAMHLSGETSKTDTVNRALREYAERHGRIEALAQASRPGPPSSGSSRPRRAPGS